MTDYAKIKNLVNSSQGRFCSVTFIKKDGTERMMQVQPAQGRFHVKGAQASASAQKAVATRAANHPNLFNVWDVVKKGFRSINLDTVYRVAVNGRVYRF